MIKKALLLLGILPQLIFAQFKQVSGQVTNSEGLILNNATVLALPTDKQQNLKFATTNNEGFYKLLLKANVSYTIQVSYLGFVEQSFKTNENNTNEIFNFKLKPSGENLKEIIIKYEVKPIVIKKDTIVFAVDSFANGKERKLKDQLKKLPGVEVDRDGNVTLQGKQVSNFLVENKPFFGGGTKLGVENIPADAVDKVEFLDHFSEVGFMKKVSSSKKLVMNIKLKKDKKKFVFGDVQGASGPPNFFKAHTGIFYYAPKQNYSLIADLNNIGSSTLDFSDIMRFETGSLFLLDKKTDSSLFGFAKENSDVVSNKTKFSALNFSYDISKKLEISGYVLVSNVFNKNKIETNINYFQNQNTTTENRFENENRKLGFVIGSLKIKKNPTEKFQINYDAKIKITNRDAESNLTSFSQNEENKFETRNNQKNFFFNHFLDINKQFSPTKLATFVLSNNFENKKIDNNWLSNNIFFSNFIPVQNQTQYQIYQNNYLVKKNIDALFKYYYIANNFNHFYFVLGNSLENNKFTSTENQLLDNNNNATLADKGFNNDLKQSFNDAFLGIEYKFLFKNWVTKLNLYAHNYNLDVQNFSDQSFKNKTFFEPELNIDYQISQTNVLNINIKQTNDFADFSKLTNRYVFQNFNNISRGNLIFFNQTSNIYAVNYRKNNPILGFLLNSNLSFSDKKNAFRDDVFLQGINQIIETSQQNNFEKNIRFDVSVTKKIFGFDMGLNFIASKNNYNLRTNNEESNIFQNSQNIGFAIKTASKNWPFASLKFNKIFNTLEGQSKSKFITDMIAFDIEIPFLKDFVIKTDYRYQRNNNFNEVFWFNSGDFSLQYQKENKPLLFEILIKNYLNNKTINNNSFSQFLATDKSVFVLPRIIMISISYKL
jgi:hypothetical protein